MKVLLVGLLLIGGIIGGTVIDFIMKTRRKVPSNPAEAEPVVDSELLSGVVMDISADEESGLTKITVKDGKGKLRYGFSSIPAENLKHIYMGKGWTQVPILNQKRK